MRVGNASVVVCPGVERGSGHVEMTNGQQYTMRLTNHDTRRRVDTLVEVDGREVGQFRLNPGEQAVLERPQKDTGRFTFAELGTTEGQAAGLDAVPNSNLGLVRVTFRFELLRAPEPAVVLTGGQHTNSNPRLFRKSGGAGGQSVTGGVTPQSAGLAEEKTSGAIFPTNFRPGGTGLSGQSAQRFNTVDPLPEYDASLETVISLRLVVNGDLALRPLGSGRANPTPEPV